MTYQLAALRFRSIGERSARFTDLTLDLTAPAADSRRASVSDRDGVLCPHDSVVWLRNGGGKSSILSLLYAMLLPAANDFMGRSVQRSLTDYVDTGDTSHVIAVWQPRETSRSLLGEPEDVLITGAVHEWTDLRRPAQAARSRDRLNTSFYACHVVPGVIELDTLPFTSDDGRTRRLTGYLDALRDLAAPHARQASLAVTDKQYAWAKVLDDRRIDPEIFRTQKQMNHVEGGVEDLFKFASARDFIDFLLDLTTRRDDVNSVAQRLESITTLLAAKPKKLVERDFCVAAAADLDRVAAHQEQLQAARSALKTRREEAARLASSFAGAIAEAKASAETLAAEREVAQQSLRSANTDKSSANDLAYLYRRQAARLRIGEAEEDEYAAARHSERAQRQVRAWDLAGRLAALSDLEGDLDQAELEAAAEEEELEPLRVERDRHAAVLARRLIRLAEEAESRADEAAAGHEGALLAAEEEDSRTSAASAELELATKHEAAAENELKIMARRVGAGVAKGYLPSENADINAHRQSLQQRRADHGRRLRELQAKAERRRERRGELSRRDGKLAEERSETVNARGRATERHVALSARLAALTSSSRLRDLAEATSAEPLDLWAEGPELIRRLQNAVIAADNERILRQAELHADRQTIETQEHNAVLPTSLDAERVERLLLDAEIPAESGWAHLRNALPADRLASALDAPDVARLGCGVIVPTASVADAVRVLDSACAVTTSLVNVYSTADASRLMHSTGEHTGLVPPAWGRLDPGLVDPALAEAAVRLLKERAEAYELADRELRARREEDDELRRALGGFLTDCPAGHLEVLREEIQHLDVRLDEIDAEQSSNRSEVQGLNDADRLDDSARAALDDERQHVGIAIDWLDELIPVVAERPAWRERQADATVRATQARAAAGEHRARATEARLIAQRRAAEEKDERAKAREHRSEAAALAVEPAVIADGADDPGVPLDTLRRQWQTAKHAVDVRASQSVLADRVRRLTEDVSRARRDLAGTDPDDNTRAMAALASPAGQEPHLRAAALENARNEERKAAGEHGAASNRVRVCKTELEEVEKRHRYPPRRALPTVPRNSDQAHILAAEQEALGQQAQERVTRMEESIGALDALSDRSANRADHFAMLLDRLPDPGPSPEPPFSGDKDAGRAAARKMDQEVTAAEHHQARQETELNGAVDRLRRTASRFPDVTGPIKDRAANDGVAVLGSHAAPLAERLRLRAQTLTGEIDAIATDQTIIGEALAHLVKDSFDMLTRAERGSRMPTAQGSWAGKKVLRISFDRPGDSDLVAYAERVIDQLLAKGLRPEGMPLLKAALHEAAGPRGFTVKVLKPTTDQVSTTEDISRLAKWSGGEKLTVCVALYCTLAALRAGGAGRRGRSGGVLLLDNPIGRASSAPLVRLQRDVAAAHGIQLVYTTGVKDPAAVIQFPNIIRLDNREGRTRNRRYIVPEEGTIANDRAPGDGVPTRGEVTGIRSAHVDHAVAAESADAEDRS